MGGGMGGMGGGLNFRVNTAHIKSNTELLH